MRDCKSTGDWGVEAKGRILTDKLLPELETGNPAAGPVRKPMVSFQSPFPHRPPMFQKNAAAPAQAAAKAAKARPPWPGEMPPAARRGGVGAASQYARQDVDA